MAKIISDEELRELATQTRIYIDDPLRPASNTVETIYKLAMGLLKAREKITDLLTNVVELELTVASKDAVIAELEKEVAYQTEKKQTIFDLCKSTIRRRDSKIASLITVIGFWQGQVTDNLRQLVLTIASKDALIADAQYQWQMEHESKLALLEQIEESRGDRPGGDE